MVPPGSKQEGASPKLPHPQALADPQHDPFVGNETIDDNICEWARLAIWNVMADRHSTISVDVSDGTATLTGEVRGLEQRRAIAAAVAKVQGVRRVVDHIHVARRPSQRPPSARQATSPVLDQVAARPMLYVVRHCVLDEASMSAAMRQAVPTLDEALAAHGAAPAHELIVIYRNRVPGAVTVEIGVPVDLPPDMAIRGEPALGQSPDGAMLSRVADAGLPALLRREAELVATARSAGLEARSFFWQSFPYEQTHPWTGHPEARIFLPIAPHPENDLVAPSGVQQ